MKLIFHRMTLVITLMCSVVFTYSFLQKRAAGFQAFQSLSGTPYIWNLSALSNGQVLWNLEPGAPEILRQSMLAVTKAWTEASEGKVQFAEGPGGIAVSWDAGGAQIMDRLFLAYTTFFASSSNTIQSARIVVNAFNYSWQRGGYGGVGPAGADGKREANLDSVMMHELGHALGLDHSDRNSAGIVGMVGYNNYPTMNSVIYPGAETLHGDDIAGVRTIYGVPLDPSPVLSPLVLSSTPKALRPKQRVVFTAMDGNRATVWSLGDGTTSIGKKIRHKYLAEGTYTVSANHDGQAGTLTVTVKKKRK